MKKSMTPLRAARAKCLWCCLNQPVEVRLCPVTRCELHPYRMGTGNITLRDLRMKCIECNGGRDPETGAYNWRLKVAKDCGLDDCPIRQFWNSRRAGSED